MLKTFSSRHRLFLTFILLYLVFSTIVRIIFYTLSFTDIAFSIIHFFRMLLTGLFFDIGTISYFSLFYALYLLIFPIKLNGSVLDKVITYCSFSLGIIILLFSFFAEFTFWEEFKSRFNFIAVDYLIYTYEVIENINESYPLPYLIGAIILLALLVIFSAYKIKAFSTTFNSHGSFMTRLKYFSINLIVVLVFSFFIKNNDAEWSDNRYENELSKSGIYSFFGAFRNNELNYDYFYLTQKTEKSAAILKPLVISSTDKGLGFDENIVKRKIISDSTESTPNIIFICIESFSADFMGAFGNTENITPYLDELVEESILFTNLYATGTRTVRGMEAITLSVPPSPGRSIVKRVDNSGLFNIGTIFSKKGYKNTFYYGGDGYFDNMNAFFGGNSFDIVDRGRGYLMGDNIQKKRINIEDDEIQFENAWGVCDEDIYNKVLKLAGKNHESGTPFFNFIMTTSNHRPYTYPDNKINITSGEGRHGAVKYTDFAIKEFIEKAKTKPWFENTVFVIMADHCASSAGRWELEVPKYLIPALVYNLKNHAPEKIDKLCSQIDLFPTLFGYLNWSYESQFFGKDISRFSPADERAFIGNYRKLGLLKKENLVVLSDKKDANYYNVKNGILTKTDLDSTAVIEAISYYQYNDYLYKNGLLKK